MSYFNADQEDYMDSLATVPPEKRCWCGWALWGECYPCKNSHTVGTAADKVSAAKAGREYLHYRTSDAPKEKP